jgi:hypothetical protein
MPYNDQWYQFVPAVHRLVADPTGKVIVIQRPTLGGRRPLAWVGTACDDAVWVPACLRTRPCLRLWHSDVLSNRRQVRRRSGGLIELELAIQAGG